jgi:DNA-binding transcriptional regulator LsrR (DeoR family)
MVDNLPNEKLQARMVVDLAGGFGQISSSLSARAVTLRSAEKLKAECVQLPAPTIVDSVSAARSMLNETTIRRTLELAAQAHVAVTGIGPITLESLLYQSGFVSEDEMRRLQERGAVGSIIGRFYDINGSELVSEFRDRAIALSLDAYRRIPERIALGAGDGKVQSIIGLARGQLITTLVTDSQTATTLLTEADEAHSVQ